MSNLQSTIHYTADDMAFFAGRPQKTVDREVLLYLAEGNKTLSGTLPMRNGMRHSFDLFCTEPREFSAPSAHYPFLFRLGVFLMKSGVIHLVTHGPKPLGFVLPKTFALNGADVQEAGTYTFHVFSYPQNRQHLLPAPFPVDLFVTHERTSV